MEYSIPVFLESQVDGIGYVFSAITDDYSLQLPVSLEDKKTGVIHNLGLSAYSFIHDRSFSTDRFTLHFGNSTPSSVQVLTLTQPNVYVDGASFMVDLQELSGTASIEVVDLLGRIWYSSILQQGKQEIPLSENAKGLLIVKILNGSQINSFRVFK